MKETEKLNNAETQALNIPVVIARSFKIDWWNALSVEKCAEYQNNFLSKNLKTRVDIALAKIHIMSCDVVKIYDSLNVL